MSLLDLAIIAAYLLGITLFGLRFRKKQRSLRDYFLADRNIPWWAIALSIVAAETSTLTIISVPGSGLRYQLRLPAIGDRLSGRTRHHQLPAVAALLSRRSLHCLPTHRAPLWRPAALAHCRPVSGDARRRRRRSRVRGCDRGGHRAGTASWQRGEFQRDVISIGIVTAADAAVHLRRRHGRGHLDRCRAVGIYLAGTLVGLFTIVHLVPGGWAPSTRHAASAGKFRVFDFTPDFYRTYTFWSGVIGGAFLTTASHGTDQLIVQRLLAARNEAQSKLALLSSGLRCSSSSRSFC